ncbi:MAG: hypothetical protein ACKPKO_58450, partial [Candidatus Fonsibacter sp.]
SQVRPAVAEMHEYASVGSLIDTNDESKPEQKKRGRTNMVGGDDVIMSDPTTPEEEPNPPPFPFLSHDKGACKSALVYFKLLAQHIVSVVVFL